MERTRCRRTGKVRYPTPGDAECSRRRVLRVFNDRVEVYPCRHCGGYHLGHARAD